MMIRRSLLVAVMALGLAACGGDDREGADGTPGELRPDGGAAVSTQSAVTGMPVGETRSADPALIELYKKLHANPELSFREVETSKLMADELRALGFTVTEGLGDAWVREKAMKDVGRVLPGVGGYGVVGVFENGRGPTVLIRADMDGLPVPDQTGFEFASKVVSQTWTGVESPVMHACAHDIHMTVWVGTARELIANADKWKGTLVMIAQPAEEIGLGAQAMLADGLYSKFPLPDYNIALHVSASAPAGVINYSSGYALANVDSVDIKVKGAGGHGAYPQTTRDPVLIGAHIVTALQSLVSRNTNPLDSAVVTVGSFKAGAKHNIISDEAELLITVRSYDDKTRQMLLDGIRRIAEGQAAAFGAPAPEIRIESDYTPATYNDPALTERAMKAVAKKLGEENVRAVPPVMGGEDFSQFARTDEKVPGVIFWLGAVNPDKFAASQIDGMPLPSLHSPLFGPDYDPAIATGVEAMTTAAIDLFKD
ncbi:M20 family metallopeptidase [Hyphomonas sp.]|uniref:M20 metallopeptidase family protein n=1 Tax=Hyphomonas sp. TaxID=87 RepID=UPI002617AFF6|nr:amidohydrolase [Hyphomonas sp.]